MCQVGFLRKGENQGCELFEDSREDYPMGTHPESSIAVEAKIANLMRRIEVLETKESSFVNQVSPSQTPG